MLKSSCLFTLLALIASITLAQPATLTSPDGTVRLTLTANPQLSWSVTMDNQPIILDSPLTIELTDGTILGNDVQILSRQPAQSSQTWRPVVGRKSTIVDHHHQLTLRLRQTSASNLEYTLICRAFNDGVAFRYLFDQPATLAIKEEHTQFTFPGNYTCWPAFLNSYNTEHQALYPKETLSAISPEDIIGPPLTIQIAPNRFCSITEAALTNWSGMYLTRPGQSQLLVQSDAFVGGGQPFNFHQTIPDNADKIRFVIEALDGNSHDHVDIANARLINPASGKSIWLSDLKPTVARQEWGSLKLDRSVDNNPITIANKTYPKGLGTHAGAVITYPIPAGYTEIAGSVGIDSEVENRGRARMLLYAVPEPTGDHITLKTTLSRTTDNPASVTVKTPQASPWRVLMLGRTAADLVNSDIVLNLNEPSRIADTSWIQSGVSSWNWLSCGGDMDMALLKSFIDLSASMGWEYTLIDDGWYQNWNCTTSINKLNIPALVDYARQRNVKLWLWVHWQALDRRLEEAFTLYQQWGIAGVKTDFMARDDQWMVNWYQKVLASAAEHKLMINFHGCYKPTGLRRTWPNLMTREAIYGEEQNLGSRQNDPIHKTTLPFTRMLAGPMDYTPGSMLNETSDTWSAGRPVKTLGTRCQELALCVIYDNPILSMADKPENYANQPGVDFLKNLPATWDDTKVLNGEIGQYITTARKSGNTWYLAAITNWDKRKLNIPLSFLSSGRHQVTLYQDGPDAAKNARDLVRSEQTVTAQDTLSIPLAPGGGFVATFQQR